MTACFITFTTLSQAQMGVQKTRAGVAQRPDRTTPILNLVTGQRMTMEAYEQLARKEPDAYHLVPDYNEYGHSNTYTLRPATPEERELHRFRDRDPAKQPKAGQPIAPFVMTGSDGKTYRSADLLGKVVILSFWIGAEKEFLSDEQRTDFATALQPYRSPTGLVVLGVLNSELPKNPNIKSLPFTPVPNAYGFHNKYHITGVPTVVVIDKAGNVAANLQGAGVYDKLKQVLARVTK
ncbi:TlpA family protein disulfide reductase [Spirosoma areae]